MSNQTHEREVIVTDGGHTHDRGFGAAIVAIVTIVVLALLGFFVFKSLSGDDESPVPDEVDVNITDTGGDSGSNG